MPCLCGSLTCVTWPSNQTINAQRAQPCLTFLMLYLCTKRKAGHGGVHLFLFYFICFYNKIENELPQNVY